MVVVAVMLVILGVVVIVVTAIRLVLLNDRLPETGEYLTITVDYHDLSHDDAKDTRAKHQVRIAIRT